jgi:PAS domain-containing protein
MSDQVQSRPTEDHPGAIAEVPPPGGALSAALPPDRDGGEEPLHAVVVKLREEVEQLRRSRKHRSVIEQAKGVLMARLGVGPDDAFERLVRYSQRTNQKLTRVAAAVVAATVTADRPVARGAEGPDPVALLTEPRWDPDLEPAADLHLVAAALGEARDLAELIRCAVTEAAAPLGVAAGLIGALEPDGALRLVAGHGYDQTLMSAWHRIPPTLDVPLHAAVTSQAPVLLADVRERVARFPLTADLPRTYEGQASLPLVRDGRVVGVLGLSWAGPVCFEPPTRRALTDLASQLTAPFLRLLQAEGDVLDPVAVEVPSTRWFRAVLDALQVPCALLDPIRDDDGRVIDFTIAFNNAAAARVNAVSFPDGVRGRRMLETFPDLAEAGLFELFLTTLRTGEPHRMETAEFLEDAGDGQARLRVIDLAIARLGDGLLASWIEPDRM